MSAAREEIYVSNLDAQGSIITLAVNSSTLFVAEYDVPPTQEEIFTPASAYTIHAVNTTSHDHVPQSLEITPLPGNVGLAPDGSHLVALTYNRVDDIDLGTMKRTELLQLPIASRSGSRIRCTAAPT